MTYDLVLVLALICHQLNTVLRDGTESLRHGFAPVLGWRPPAVLAMPLQILALPACALIYWLLPVPYGWFAVVLLAAWISVQNWRLANHVWLAFVALVLLQLPAGRGSVSPLLLGAMYASAGAFKLNGQFLRSEESYGRTMIRLYAGYLRIRPPQILLRAAPVAVAVVELGLGAGLLLNLPVQPLFVVAVGLHFVFGISGNFPFSLVAVVLWALQMDPAGRLRTPSAAGLAATMAVFVAGLLLTTRSVYRKRRVGALAAGTFAGLYALTVYSAAIASGHGSPRPIDWFTPLAVVITAAAVLNLGSVVLGYRSEAAFAMFSNIQPFGPAKPFGLTPRWRARYYTLSLPEAFPAALLDRIPATLLYRSTGGRNFVYEPFAYQLERIARDSRVSFEPRQVLGPPRTGLPRPGPLLFPPLLPNDLSKAAMR
ncbi:hypothetical protein [Kribbella sp. NPDC048928]|uniref:hypothetical protein n=1 Tax=Kribbella sp. NPDC048928 TaxID=3364111 RepID=UPI0037179C5D